MAKTNMIERDKRRCWCEEIRRGAHAPEGSDPQPQVLPGGACGGAGEAAEPAAGREPDRQRNRCAITGRSRGVYRKSAWRAARSVKLPARGEFPGLPRRAGGPRR